MGIEKTLVSGNVVIIEVLVIGGFKVDNTGINGSLMAVCI